MDRHDLQLLDGCGAPLDEPVRLALVRVAPRAQRVFPFLRDDLLLVEALEAAGCKIIGRRMDGGQIENLGAYAWVVVRSVAKSWLRSGRWRVAERTIASDAGNRAIARTPARSGTADQMEMRLFLRELLRRLTPLERFVCSRRAAGFSHEEIARLRGTSRSAVNSVVLRVRGKARKLLDATGRDRRNRQLASAWLGIDARLAGRSRRTRAGKLSKPA